MYKSEIDNETLESTIDLTHEINQVTKEFEKNLSGNKYVRPVQFENYLSELKIMHDDYTKDVPDAKNYCELAAYHMAKKYGFDFEYVKRRCEEC